MHNRGIPHLLVNPSRSSCVDCTPSLVDGHHWCTCWIVHNLCVLYSSTHAGISTRGQNTVHFPVTCKHELEGPILVHKPGMGVAHRVVAFVGWLLMATCASSTAYWAAPWGPRGQWGGSRGTPVLLRRPFGACRGVLSVALHAFSDEPFFFNITP
jgi:hypothetical protein